VTAPDEPRHTPPAETRPESNYVTPPAAAAPAPAPQAGSKPEFVQIETKPERATNEADDKPAQ
jgi:hypothetical protein